VGAQVPHAGHPERPQRALRRPADRLARVERDLLVAGQAALAEVPQPPAGLAPGDADLAPQPQEVEHEPDGALARGPAQGVVGDGGPVLDLAGRERPVGREAVEHVGAEGRLGLEEGEAAPAARRVAPGPGPHGPAVDRGVGGADE
jgi:hypothetical protein